MTYSLWTLMVVAPFGPPLFGGLYPLRGLYLLLVIFGVILIAALGTYWNSRRVYAARLDDETVERLNKLKDDQAQP